MDVVVVRTKLQALIVAELVRLGIVSRPFHLILFEREEEPAIDVQTRPLGALAATTSTINRGRGSAFACYAVLLRALRNARKTGGCFHCASISIFSLALAVKLNPHVHVKTFDDGSANIVPSGVYFSERPTGISPAGRWLARRLLPQGPSRFFRDRTEHHYSIYHGCPNIVESARLTFIDIDWNALFQQTDVRRIPAGASRILLGSVYYELDELPRGSFFVDRLPALKEWCDVYVPHPRYADSLQGDGFDSPAEAIIAHCAQRTLVTVAHFASSAAIPFQHSDRVKLIDLTQRLPDELGGATVDSMVAHAQSSAT